MIDERSRHQLYTTLEERLGEQEADTLMELLPPVGWADVATKHDLIALEERIDLRFEGLEERFATKDDLRSVRDDLHAQTRFLFTSMLGMMITLGAFLFTALH